MSDDSKDKPKAGDKAVKALVFLPPKTAGSGKVSLEEGKVVIPPKVTPKTTPAPKVQPKESDKGKGETKSS